MSYQPIDVDTDYSKLIPHSKQSPAAWNINPFNLDLYLPTFYISQPEKHVLPDFAIVPNTAALIS